MDNAEIVLRLQRILELLDDYDNGEIGNSALADAMVEIQFLMAEIGK